jgi:hypothetical protein
MAAVACVGCDRDRRDAAQFRGQPADGGPGPERAHCLPGLRGLELANVILGKSLKCWVNSRWITRTFWDLRPFARELQQDFRNDVCEFESYTPNQGEPGQGVEDHSEQISLLMRRADGVQFQWNPAVAAGQIAGIRQSQPGRKHPCKQTYRAALRWLLSAPPQPDPCTAANCVA